MQIATIYMGFKPAEFGELRPAVFLLMLDELNQKQQNEYRQRAELVRFQTTILVNIQLKKEDQLKPSELWPFDWDEPTGIDAELNSMTDEQIKQHNKRLMALLD